MRELSMGEREIALSYIKAKRPQTQIGILADLNATTKKSIVGVINKQKELLKAYGLEPVKLTKRVVKHHVFPPELIEQAYEMRLRGSTYKEIAAALNVSHEAMRQRVVKKIKMEGSNYGYQD